jgi:hypothetical protein
MLHEWSVILPPTYFLQWLHPVSFLGVKLRTNVKNKTKNGILKNIFHFFLGEKSSMLEKIC